MPITSFIQQFRQSVYQILTKRANAALDFIDALTVAGHVSSPVALSEEKPFRRQFSSIYHVALWDFAWQPPNVGHDFGDIVRFCLKGIPIYSRATRNPKDPEK